MELGCDVREQRAESGGANAVDEEFLDVVLQPYKPHCRYLKRAWFSGRSPASGEKVSAKGAFAIPKSCYIADTGHFNAVEFNICYNQLVYTLLACCVGDGLFPVLGGWTLGEYRRRQLADFLIVRLETKFAAPMKSDRFEGLVAIDRVAVRNGSAFIKTSACMADHRGGSAEGEVVLAIVDTASTRPSRHGAAVLQP